MNQNQGSVLLHSDTTASPIPNGTITSSCHSVVASVDDTLPMTVTSYGHSTCTTTYDRHGLLSSTWADSRRELTMDQFDVKVPCYAKHNRHNGMDNPSAYLENELPEVFPCDCDCALKTNSDGVVMAQDSQKDSNSGRDSFDAYPATTAQTNTTSNSRRRCTTEDAPSSDLKIPYKALCPNNSVSHPCMHLQQGRNENNPVLMIESSATSRLYNTSANKELKLMKPLPVCDNYRSVGHKLKETQFSRMLFLLPCELIHQPPELHKETSSFESLKFQQSHRSDSNRLMMTAPLYRNHEESECKCDCTIKQMHEKEQRESPIEDNASEISSSERAGLTESFQCPDDHASTRCYCCSNSHLFQRILPHRPVCEKDGSPPDVTWNGYHRGNFAALHRKAWLEVADVPRHRYGKHLRIYYKHWEQLKTSIDFWDWLDSKGCAQGCPLPDLAVCPRSVLDSDTVMYLTDEEQASQYALSIVAVKGRGRVVQCKTGQPVYTREAGWIFVLRDNVLYGARKITNNTDNKEAASTLRGQRQPQRQRFHHSSFFGGKAVSAAGILLTDEEGFLTKLLPHSGHYRPGPADLQRTLHFLHLSGVCLDSFSVDVQQLQHVSRDDTANMHQNQNNGSIGSSCTVQASKKAKKMESLHLQTARHVSSLLEHQACMLHVLQELPQRYAFN